MSTDNSEDSICGFKKAEAISSSAFTLLFFVPLHE